MRLWVALGISLTALAPFFWLHCKSSPTETSVRGEQIFRKYCIACHPIDNTKNLFTSRLQPPPRDFEQEGLRHGKTLPQIERNIRKGIGGSVMPAFEERLPDHEIEAVARFIYDWQKGQ